MYSHLEINSALEKVDEGRLAMGIQGPAPPCPEKKAGDDRARQGEGPEVRPHHHRLFKIDATGGDQVQLRGDEEHPQY